MISSTIDTLKLPPMFQMDDRLEGSDPSWSRSAVFRALFKFILYFFVIYAILLLHNVGVVIIVAGMLIIWFVYKRITEPIVVLSILFSENFLEFVDYSSEHLPSLNLAPGLNFTPLELVMIPAAIASYKMLSSKGRLSGVAYLVLFQLAVPLVHFIATLFISSNASVSGAYMMKIYTCIGFYFVARVYIDSREKFVALYQVMGWFVIFASSILMCEFVLNYRVQLPGFNRVDPYYSVEGVVLFTLRAARRLYLWPRGTMMAYFTFVMSFVFLYLKIGKRWFNVLVFLLSASAFVIASVRVWIIILFSTSVVILVFGGSFRKTIKIVILTVVLFVGVLGSAGKFISEATGIPLIESLSARIGSIFEFGRAEGELDSVTPRVVATEFLFEAFLDSPLYGYGINAGNDNPYMSADLGIINQAVRFGLLGTLPLLVTLIWLAVSLAIKRGSTRDKSIQAVCLISAAILLGHLPGYMFQLDFWAMRWLVLLSMALAIADWALHMDVTEGHKEKDETGGAKQI